MMKVAALGECMLEISNAQGPHLSKDMSCRFSYGGDTLNTAIYLARLGVQAGYITALGHDTYSDWLLTEWQSEGLATHAVDRSRDLLPGLYMIQTDATGERSFQYWRAQSAARAFFSDPNQVAGLATALADLDWLYFSGISLSLMSEEAFEAFLMVLKSACQKGLKIAFDSNYRPKNWPNAAAAKWRYIAIFGLCQIVLPTFTDEAQLSQDGSVEQCAARYRDLGVAEVVVKADVQGAYVVDAETSGWVPAVPVQKVLDATGAGDAFNAAYLASRFDGANVQYSASRGHRLAAEVIQHPGAIIPLTAMPDERGTV